MKLRTIFAASLGLTLLLTFIANHAEAQTKLVISQVYGGGGNSGATYTNDYVELYNPTTASISLAGDSIQYASATGSSWTNKVNLPSVSVAAGHYYLVALSSGGSNGVSLPTADATGTINMSASAGKVALVSNTTALTGTCPLSTSTAIIDFVGYGSTVNCPTDGSYAPTLSNTTADIRSGYSGVNSADFQAGTPNPHNSSWGDVVTGLVATGAATPSTLNSGSSTLLTIAVTPATSPTSLGIAVTVDLSAIGGSSAQKFYDDGSNGDVSSGDNTFSFTTTATVSASATIALPATVTDAQGRSTTTTISVIVNIPPPVVAIHTIQGSKSLSVTTVSPYAGQTVTTQGIVTGVGSVGYFIQTPDSDVDSDSSTPEGIYVYAGSGKVPAGAVIGNYVQVTGAISTYPAATASHTPATELSSTAATVLSTGNALPTAITLDATKLTPSGGLYQLTPYEGMRVAISSLTSVSGTDGSLSSEANETVTSNGEFYAVISGTKRPFREPGVDVRDSASGLPAGVTYFDDNPERVLVDADFLKGSSIELSTGAILPAVTGILDFTYSSDSYYDPARLLLDASYDRSTVVAGNAVIAPPDAASNEFRVVGYNVERFFNTTSSDNIDYVPITNKTETSSAVNVSSAAYARRLAKLSLAIRHVLKNPDIIALEEVENETVAADIATQISNDAVAAGETDPQYQPYGSGTTYAPYTNDVGGISVGFLVKQSTVNALSVTQYGANELFIDPRDNSTEQILNDRPPLVLHAGIRRSGATDYPITVIVNHLRSLSGENSSSTGTYVRRKKELQAEYLANLIQNFQLSGEHVVSVGDYNAFEFSDGYIDILGTITNQNVLSSSQVLEPGVAGLVDPAATDLVTLLPAEERWSYQEYGNAQVLDHVVATADLVAAGAHMAFAHLNADQPLSAYSDATTPARTSDHDAAVGYFTIPAPVLSASLTGTGSFGSVDVGSNSAGESFVLTNTGEGAVTINGIQASGDFSQTNNCGTTLDLNAGCTINVVFAPASTGTRTGTLSVNTNTAAGSYTAALSGVGLPVYDKAITVQYGSTTLTYPGATNLTACVTAQGSSTATGNITLFDGSTLLKTFSLQGNGCAYWYITPGLAAGTHSLSASYSGDSQNAAGISVPTTITVSPVSVNLGASCWNSTFSYGANYQCTVNGSSNAGAATGSITWQLDGADPVVVALSNGNAQFTLPLPMVGSHTVAIAYAQQGNFAAATAATQQFTVTSAPVYVALTPSTWYASAGSTISFRSAVSSWSAGAPKATGSVTFSDGATVLGTVPVDASGVASFAVSTLAAGSHTITATYANGSNYASGSSSVSITLAQ